MFAPKSCKSPSAGSKVSTGGLRKPSTTCTPTSTSASAAGKTVAKTPSAAAQRQASASSLLTAGKSASRSSVHSDTTTISVQSATATQPSMSSTRTASGSTSVRIGCVGRSASSMSSRSALASKPSAGAGLSSKKSGPSSVASCSSVASSSASSSAAAVSRRVPTLAMSLRDKDQQIKLLIKERDEQKFQAEVMARKAEEWEEKFMQSEVEKSHVTSEADDEVVELRRLAQELEDENRKLATQLAEREQSISDTQFKLDELDCERSDLRKQLEDKEQQLCELERERQELVEGKPVIQVTTERTMSKVKYEREIEELKEKLLGKDEQMIQLRSSLEMRKNEVANLQAHARDLERKLKIESERSERHLKRIDEINLELKAAEAKLSTRAEENEMYEKQVRQLRQELRAAEDKLEQVSLARKKDVDILHNKLSAARRGASTPTSPQPYKTPTPQDEIVRLQMEIRELKDQLIDREAELDCNRRDLEVMRRKMETRTLEVDCNNQELARRCQDLLEQNRQSEDTVKQLLKSTTEHSAQLMRATEDLKEANGKCVKLREQISELERKLDEEMDKSGALVRDNSELREENEELRGQVEALRQQVDSLNEQLGDLCDQLDIQANSLHKDREALADQLSQNEIELAQVRSDLASARQDLRTSKLQTQEVASERDRLRSDVEIKEKYIGSRNDIIETLRHELEDCKKSLADARQKLEDLRHSAHLEAGEATRELRAQLEALKSDCSTRQKEKELLEDKCAQLELQLAETKSANDEEELRKFDEMRRKHSAELDVLSLKLKDLEDQLEEERSATLRRASSNSNSNETRTPKAACNGTSAAAGGSLGSAGSSPAPSTIGGSSGSQSERTSAPMGVFKGKDDYETQIEFLNSLVVDMQRKCDDYRNRLAQVETSNIMLELDQLIPSNGQLLASQTGTMRRNGAVSNKTVANDHRGVLAASGATLARPVNRPNGVGPLGAHNPAKPLGSGERVPARISGRPFCDICNVYDFHHTIYCPKVSEKLAARQLDASDSHNNNNNNNISINNSTSNSNNNNNSINFDTDSSIDGASYKKNKNKGNHEANINIANNMGAPGKGAANDVQEINKNDPTSISNYVDELFREYEQSIQSASVGQFSSLRRPQTAEKPPRPYCDHCDLFGHTIKSCSSLKV